MREIHGHEANEANKQLRIVADDVNPENGNASHLYTIFWTRFEGAFPYMERCAFSFQNGPIKEVGINGVTNEALLAIVADRLNGFQTSKYACQENGDALHAVQNALYHLKQRTKSRELRGVEGTHEV